MEIERGIERGREICTAPFPLPPLVPERKTKKKIEECVSRKNKPVFFTKCTATILSGLCVCSFNNKIPFCVEL